MSITGIKSRHCTHFSFLANASPLHSLPAVTTKLAPTWNELPCKRYRQKHNGERERERERGCYLAIFQYNALLELNITANHGTLNRTTIPNGNMIHNNRINNLQISRKRREKSLSTQDNYAFPSNIYAGNH